MALPAFADDDARANRLMVEAVGLIAAAERGALGAGALPAPSAGARAAARHRRTPPLHRSRGEARDGPADRDRVARRRPRGPGRGEGSPATQPHRSPRGGPALRCACGGIGRRWLRSAGPRAAAGVSSVSRDGVAATRDIATGATLHTWRYDGQVTAAALSPDGRRMLTAGARGAVTLSDTATGETLARWKHDHAPGTVALFPRGRRALVAVASAVMVGGTGTLEVLHTWRHLAPVTAVAVSPDRRRVLMGLAGGEGVLGDAKTGATLATWEHPGSGGRGLTSAGLLSGWTTGAGGRGEPDGGAARRAVRRDPASMADPLRGAVRRLVAERAVGVDRGRWLLGRAARGRDGPDPSQVAVQGPGRSARPSPRTSAGC